MHISFLLGCFLCRIRPRLLTISCFFTVCLFFLPKQYAFLFLLSTGLGTCCSSTESMKAIKPRKYFSTSSGVHSLFFVILYTFSRVLVSIVLPIFQSFACLYCKSYFGLGQTESQLGYRLVKDDSKQVILEICFLYHGWKVDLHRISFF